MLSLSVFMTQRVPLLRSRLSAWFARKLDDQKPKGAIAALDGVRAIAFLIVFYYHMMRMDLHTGLWNAGHMRLIDALAAEGETGVTLFFVLSGFLLFLPYAKALLFHTSWPEAKIFYMRRILRIFPGYFFALFLLVMLKTPYLLAAHNWNKLLPFLTFTMDFSNSQPIDGPLWTLAVECQYYLVLPVLAFAMYGLTRLVRPEKRLWVTIGCLLAMILWGVSLTVLVHPPVALPISRASLHGFLTVVYGERGKFPEDFAVGMLAATLYVFLTNAPGKDHALQTMQRISPILGIGSIVLFVYLAMHFYSLGSTYNWPLLPGLFRLVPWSFDQEIDFAFCYGCLIVAALFNRPGGVFRRFFEWTPLRWLGTLSFSLYIWHDAFLHTIQYDVVPSLHVLNHYVAIALTWVLASCLIFPFCFLVYGMIEKPGMNLSGRLRKRMGEKKRTPDPVVPQNPPSLLLSRENRPAVETRLEPDKEALAKEITVRLPAQPHTDSWQSNEAQPQASSRMARSRHRLQPLPVHETEPTEPSGSVR